MLADVGAEIEQLPTADTITRLRSAESELRRLEAEIAVMVGVLDRRGAFRVDGHASIGGLLRAELRWSNAEVTHRVRAARLVAELSQVMEALWAGEIGVGQARAFGKAHSNPRCGDQLVEHAEILLSQAQALSYDSFSICVRRWETLADADGAHRDSQATHERRAMSITEHDGEGHIVARCGAADLAEIREIWQRFSDAEFTTEWESTRHIHGDQASYALMPRTDAQRGFDAFKQMCVDAVATPAGTQPPEPTVKIVIDAYTFETAIEEMLSDAAVVAADAEPAPRPQPPVDQIRCETSDGTLITPAEAVIASLRGHVRRVVLDSAGNVIDFGRRRRLFEGAARQAVLLQAFRCIWPGCQIPAGRCQTDHIDEWQFGGETCPSNGAPLCGRHNRWKTAGYKIWREHHGHWHTYRPDGTEIGRAA